MLPTIVFGSVCLIICLYLVRQYFVKWMHAQRKATVDYHPDQYQRDLQARVHPSELRSGLLSEQDSETLQEPTTNANDSSL